MFSKGGRNGTLAVLFGGRVGGTERSQFYSEGGGRNGTLANSVGGRWEERKRCQGRRVEGREGDEKGWPQPPWRHRRVRSPIICPGQSETLARGGRQGRSRNRADHNRCIFTMDRDLPSRFAAYLQWIVTCLLPTPRRLASRSRAKFFFLPP